MRLGLGLGLGVNRGGGGGDGGGENYEVESITLFSQMLIEPSNDIKAIYNELIVSLKNAGIFSKLDILQLYYTAHTQQSCLLNVVNPLQTGITENNPTWTVKKGYSTSGTAYIRTGFIPSEAVTKFKRDTAFIGMMVHTALVNGGWYEYGYGTSNPIRYNTGNGGVSVVKVNYAANVNTFNVTADTKFVAGTRFSDTIVHNIADSIYSDPVSANSVAIPVIVSGVTDIALGAYVLNDGTVSQYKVVHPSVFFAGSYITSGEWESFRTAINLYVSQMGAL